ncbi:hypothetical protein HU200_051088 [Digitaria exilis]|uniref:Uncharacterized protein n=1 Tax=Digitaria exilis TaxID=1010633 RepID=A0A835E5C9_9POAL|nr:hypothetical protein HU200_051088 [Digitaria exilis]
MMPPQFKPFMESKRDLWCEQKLAGKPAGFFFSTGDYRDGTGSRTSSLKVRFVSHGMMFVPVGYTFGAGMFEMREAKGGSPYGAGTIAGDGSRVPTQLELQQAFHQGKYFAGIAKKLKGSALLLDRSPWIC